MSYEKKMNNLCGVDKGALTMAKNVLKRAGKHEVSEALSKTVVELDVSLKEHDDLCVQLLEILREMHEQEATPESNDVDDILVLISHYITHKKYKIKR